MKIEPKNPRFQESVEQIFAQARFVNDLGIRLVQCGPGSCETALTIEGRHLQQDGYVHAGVIITLADHCAGGAATTAIAADERILSIDLNVSLLRKGSGPSLHCRSDLLKPGRNQCVAEASVFQGPGPGGKLVAKAIVTMAVQKVG